MMKSLRPDMDFTFVFKFPNALDGFGPDMDFIDSFACVYPMMLKSFRPDMDFTPKAWSERNPSKIKSGHRRNQKHRMKNAPHRWKKERATLVTLFSLRGVFHSMLWLC